MLQRLRLVAARIYLSNANTEINNKVTNTVKLVFPPSEYIKIDVSWEIVGRELTALRPLDGFKGPLLRRTRMEGRTIVDGREGRREGAAKGKEENEGVGTREGGIAS